MTEYDQDGAPVYEVDYGAAPPTGLGRVKSVLSTLSGAAMGVAVVAGLFWWLAGLGEREAESLPVFRAATHPVRTVPADPGGAVTPYRDVTSYEAGQGTAGQAAETTLAPGPATPGQEDVAMAALEPVEPVTALAQAEPEPAVADEPEPEPDPVLAEPEPVRPAAPAPPVRPADLAARAAEEREAREAAARAKAEAERQRAAETAVEAPSEPEAPVALTSQQSVDEAAQLATRAALSPVQIQLGAYTDRGFTESEWRRISAGNKDLLGGRALAIQSTVSGGARYYRLRVGPFRDRSEAARICEALKSRGQDCIVAVNS